MEVETSSVVTKWNDWPRP